MNLKYCIALLLATALAACNGAQLNGAPPVTDSAATPLIVLITKESGGCVRIGPNCALYTLYNDGYVTVARAGIGDVETTGQIDSGLVTSFIDAIAATDFDSLRSRLPAGICAGCYDGVDYEYEIQTNSAPVVFNSIEVKFDTAEPFFALSSGIYTAMQNAAPLTIRQRN